jgi:hypothetical protein
VDVSTVAFGPAGAPPMHSGGHEPLDWNGDGFLDKVFHFETKETGIQHGDVEACVTGVTFDGTPFEGCDAIVTVPRCGLGFELVLLLPAFVWLRGRGHRTCRSAPKRRP